LNREVATGEIRESERSGGKPADRSRRLPQFSCPKSLSQPPPRRELKHQQSPQMPMEVDAIFRRHFFAESTITGSRVMIPREDFAGGTVECCRFGSCPSKSRTTKRTHKSFTENNLRQKNLSWYVLAQQLRLWLSQFDNKQANACIKA
jgi:hypothetical protein